MCRLFCTCLPKLFLKHFDSFRFKGHDSPLGAPFHALYRLDEELKDIQTYLRCHVNITFGSWKIYRQKFIVAGNPSDPVHAFLTRCQTCSISLNMSRIFYVFDMPHATESLLRQTTPQQLETHQRNAEVIRDIKLSKTNRKNGEPLDVIFGSLRNIRSGWHLPMQSQVVPDWEESNASFGLCVETKFCIFLRIQNERMLWIVEDSNIGRSLICPRSISSLALVYRPGCV